MRRRGREEEQQEQNVNMKQRWWRWRLSEGRRKRKKENRTLWRKYISGLFSSVFWFLPRHMKDFLITHVPLDSVWSSVWALVSTTTGQEVSVIIIDFQSRMSPSRNSRPMPSFYNWRNWGTELQETQKPQLLGFLVLQVKPKDMFLPWSWFFIKWWRRETMKEGLLRYKESGLMLEEPGLAGVEIIL